ncbi:apolipoprotein(a)-like [Diadema setosum]|uniref:apolipoprotein(a)-like n=1 Tax=Diadema setosum TaxID=31175 RepID=UPI003B3BCC84
MTMIYYDDDDGGDEEENEKDDSGNSVGGDDDEYCISIKPSKFDVVEIESTVSRQKRDTDDDSDEVISSLSSDVEDEVQAFLNEIPSRLHIPVSFSASFHTSSSGQRATSTALPVRLQGGDSPQEGRVEVQADGVWYAVCDDEWDISDANVVCRQLGHGDASEAYRAAVQAFGYNRNGFAMDDVDCSGMEAGLSLCSHSARHNCYQWEVAGVKCNPLPPSANRVARSAGLVPPPNSPGVVVRVNLDSLPHWLRDLLGPPLPESSSDTAESATDEWSQDSESDASSDSSTGSDSSATSGSQVGRSTNVECYTSTNGQDYRGTVSETESGRPCQNWNAQTPHKHEYTPDRHPNVLGNHNYCRNPGRYLRPWCYTMNPLVVREYCSVGDPQASCTAAAAPPAAQAPQTDALSNFAIFRGGYLPGNNQRVLDSTTVEQCAQSCIDERSFVCRSFDFNKENNQCFMASVNSRDENVQFPSNTQFDFYERIDVGPLSLFDITPNSALPGHNVQALSAVSMEECAEQCLLASWACASFDFARQSNRCWLSDKTTADVSIRSDFPNNPYDFFSRRGPATPNCYTSNGEDYRGFSFTTQGGHQCANWIAAANQNVGVTPQSYPNGGIGNHNFCRNPDQDARPWCYHSSPGTSVITGWMYCNISVCATAATSTTTTRQPTTTTEPTTTYAPPPVASQEPNVPVPISRGKPAFQSSDYIGASFIAHARLAVDGNPNSNFARGSCSRTQHRRNSWWYVDLQETAEVTDIVIVVSESSAQAERLRGAVVTVGSSADDASSRETCGRISRALASQASASPHQRLRITCPSAISGRYVHIGLVSRKDYLLLCEVEVYGSTSTPVSTDTPEPPASCGPDEFQCTTGSIACVPERLECNGETDCTDGSDEDKCPDPMEDFHVFNNQYLPNREPLVTYVGKTPEECARFCVTATDFVCRSFNYVSNRGAICNLFDVSRAQNGRLFSQEGITYYERISQTPNCVDGNGTRYHPCPSGRCIPNIWLCDGDNDCNDFTDESNCGVPEGFDIRLVNGTAPNEGRIEVQYRGEWGLVCDDEWDLNDAHVACRELGYSRGAANAYTVSEFGHGTLTSILMDDVRCTGNEASLSDCPFQGWGINNCVVGEAAGILCKLNEDCGSNEFQCANLMCIPESERCNNVDDCRDNSDEINCRPVTETETWPVRLVGGRDSKSGRVEVFINNEWGTVCDDYFTIEAARVVCNQLNIAGDVRLFPQASFGEGTGRIWLDDVTCDGMEPSLRQCAIPQGVGRHNCRHNEDVGVSCGETPTVCGIRGIENGNIMARIIGGTNAKRGNWPWQAQLVLKGSGHYCGGTLVDEYHVLSAAHCFQRYGKRSFKVRLGEHNQRIDEGSEQEFDIECLYKHADYDSRTTNNDIALLRLNRPAVITQHVTPACLPSEGEFQPNHQCWISGWGNLGDSYPNTLQEARVPLLPRSTCRRPNVYGNKLTPQMFCAGFLQGGVDSCDGDSGGPLVCEKEGIWKVVGVTSWGYGCAQPNAPGVYAEVTQFLPWINEKRSTRTCT